MFNEGDTEAGVISCGQGIGLIHAIPSVKDLFDSLMKDMETKLSDGLNPG